MCDTSLQLYSEDDTENDMSPHNNRIIRFSHTEREIALIPFEINDASSNLSQQQDINVHQTHRNYKSYRRGFYILSALYAFIFGLDLMGTSFKALSGKNIGLLFEYVSNPVASLIVGILVTVLLQSSSTTTSIIVTMVGANIISPQMAIPLVMGANIGTSITNTFVSHGHIQNGDEFELAFAGATIHDIFNLCTVLILLPVEIISGLFGYPFLFEASSWLTNSLITDVSGVSFKSPLKTLVSPLVSALLVVDKNVIKANVEGCMSCVGNNVTTPSCWNVGHQICLSNAQWDDMYANANVIKSGAFSSLGDGLGGALSLTIALVVLCVALYTIIKTMKQVVVNGRRSSLMSCLYKVVTKNGCASILFGTLLTIAVQSSSITTSILTPLVGLSVISLEQMLPLTLGANIGTTCTAALASIVTESKNAVQVAMCHLLFNIIGIIIIYPIPVIRAIPLKIARHFGRLGIQYKWFSTFYILFLFLTLPILFLCISFLFQFNTEGIVAGCVLSVGLLIGSCLLFVRFDKCVHYVHNCVRARITM